MLAVMLSAARSRSVVAGIARESTHRRTDRLCEPGGFDFAYEGKVWPAEPGELFLTARIVILSGTGELANLHGRLDQAAVQGEAPTYSGQTHFGP